MSILIDKNTRVIVQGITGSVGSFQTKQMKDYGTNIVAGVTPGKGGNEIYGIPIFNSVSEGVYETNPNVSVIFVPPKFTKDAIFEAIDSEIELIVCITEGVPIHDMMEVNSYLKNSSSRLLGPNCPGLTSPDKSKVGIMPNPIHKKGNIGIVSRSGTLTYEIVSLLSKNGIGQSTSVGIGGDPIAGTSFIDILKLFEKDDETKGVVLVGEIGGSAEEDSIEFIKKMSKPVITYIVGIYAPSGKTMGHAGAIVSGKSGTALDKISAFKDAGIAVAKDMSDIVEKVAKF